MKSFRNVFVVLPLLGLSIMSAQAQDDAVANEQTGSAPDAAEAATVAAPGSVAPSALEPAVNTSAASSSAANAPASSGGVRSVVIDTLDLGTTSITGNQELPKVLYIVPWKRSDLGDLVGRPINTLLDEALAPVDPEVFERHLSYYESLNGEGSEE